MKDIPKHLLFISTAVFALVIGSTYEFNAKLVSFASEKKEVEFGIRSKAFWSKYEENYKYRSQANQGEDRKREEPLLISQSLPSAIEWDGDLVPEKYWPYKSVIDMTVDRKFIAGISPNSHINIWGPERRSPDVLEARKYHNHEVRALSISHDGKWVASGDDDNNRASTDKSIIIWERSSPLPKAIVRNIPASITSLDFDVTSNRLAVSLGTSPTERIKNIIVLDVKAILAQSAYPGEIQFSEILNDERLARQLDYGASKQTVNVVRFSPNDRYLAASGSDGNLQIFCSPNNDTSQAVPLSAEPEGEDAGASQLAFSRKNGELYLAASMPSGVGVWKLVDCQANKFTKFEELPQALSVSFSQDGQRLIAGSGKGIVKVWDWSDSKEIASMNLGLAEAEASPPLIHSVVFTSNNLDEFITSNSYGSKAKWKISQKPNIESKKQTNISRILIGVLLILFSLFASYLLFISSKKIKQIIKHFLAGLEAFIDEGNKLIKPLNETSKLLQECGNEIDKISEELGSKKIQEIVIELTESDHSSEVSSKDQSDFSLKKLINHFRVISQKVLLVKDQVKEQAKLNELHYGNFEDEIPKQETIDHIIDGFCTGMLSLSTALLVLGIWHIVSGFNEPVVKEQDQSKIEKVQTISWGK